MKAFNWCIDGIPIEFKLLDDDEDEDEDESENDENDEFDLLTNQEIPLVAEQWL